MIQTEKIEQLLTPLLNQESVELVDITFAPEASRWILRIFLDKEGGITLNDCAYLSDRIGSLLDSSNIMERSYVLEISSPGLDRVIKKEKDFIRFSGKPVLVSLKQSLEGRRHFKGVLRGYQNGSVLVECAGQLMEFVPALISEVRLDIAARL